MAGIRPVATTTESYTRFSFVLSFRFSYSISIYPFSNFSPFIGIHSFKNFTPLDSIYSPTFSAIYLSNPRNNIDLTITSTGKPIEFKKEAVSKEI